MFFLRKIISSAIRLQYRKEHLPKNLHFSESVLLNYSMFFFLSDGTDEYL
ncbi:hypothetical protein DORFOR_02544 [Dorea formicigenerans ATCC 27755]|uniref:Uncharacterized protein n=1 Tax=Dorea formicigenerans ATCC 27755 TaxID=411461 RepID=B0G8D8_9FIRM|nr:hypothetical protein DORFOR_02544 [Dorea formicigenerans ATCC 27755]